MSPSFITVESNWPTTSIGIPGGRVNDCFNTDATCDPKTVIVLGSNVHVI